MRRPGCKPGQRDNNAVQIAGKGVTIINRPLWTGDVVGIMWNYRITQDELAHKLGCSTASVSKTLRGERKPKGARERYINAVKEIALSNDRKTESGRN